MSDDQNPHRSKGGAALHQQPAITEAQRANLPSYVLEGLDKRSAARRTNDANNSSSFNMPEQQEIRADKVYKQREPIGPPRSKNAGSATRDQNNETHPVSRAPWRVEQFSKASLSSRFPATHSNNSSSIDSGSTDGGVPLMSTVNDRNDFVQFAHRIAQTDLSQPLGPSRRPDLDPSFFRQKEERVPQRLSITPAPVPRNDTHFGFNNGGYDVANDHHGRRMNNYSGSSSHLEIPSSGEVSGFPSAHNGLTFRCESTPGFTPDSEYRQYDASQVYASSSIGTPAPFETNIVSSGPHFRQSSATSPSGVGHLSESAVNFIRRVTASPSPAFEAVYGPNNHSSTGGFMKHGFSLGSDQHGLQQPLNVPQGGDGGLQGNISALRQHSLSHGLGFDGRSNRPLPDPHQYHHGQRAVAPDQLYMPPQGQHHRVQSALANSYMANQTPYIKMEPDSQDAFVPMPSAAGQLDPSRLLIPTPSLPMPAASPATQTLHVPSNVNLLAQHDMHPQPHVGPTPYRPMAALDLSKKMADTRAEDLEKNGMSPLYLGDPNVEANKSAEIPDDQNCSFWVVNLPADITYHELLGGIRNMGRIRACVINAPKPGEGHLTAAAKIVFMELEAAHRFHAHATKHGFYYRQGRARVNLNRIKTAEEVDHPNNTRVLVIKGDVKFVNAVRLTEFFRKRFDFQIDEIITHLQTGVMGIVEYRFGSWRCQASAARQSIQRDIIDVFSGSNDCPVWDIRFGQDPCAPPHGRGGSRASTAIDSDDSRHLFLN